MKQILASVLLILCSAGASASPSIDAAAQCLTDSTNGRDRKALVRWIFAAISQHPAINDLSAVTPAQLEDSHREAGQLFTRLIAEDCAKQIRAMIAENGPGSISKAFEVLGSVAMQEMMTNQKVGAAIAGLEKHSDQARISEAIMVGPGGK